MNVGWRIYQRIGWLTAWCTVLGTCNTVGAAVGLCVCTSVGAFVGTTVGAAVGSLLGAVVGFAVGASEGLNVGAFRILATVSGFSS